MALDGCLFFLSNRETDLHGHRYCLIITGAAKRQAKEHIEHIDSPPPSLPPLFSCLKRRVLKKCIALNRVTKLEWKKEKKTPHCCPGIIMPECIFMRKTLMQIFR
jgi:hypothetical protein